MCARRRSVRCSSTIAPPRGGPQLTRDPLGSLSVAKRYFVVGSAATIAWFVLVGVVSLLNRDSFVGMKPADWGNFVAGVTAPAAFLWFILAYLQQGEELRLNTRALDLQAEELRHQVEETRNLVKHTETQAEASKALAELTREQAERLEEKEREAAQPVFQCGTSTSSSGGMVVEFANLGGLARDVTVQFDDPIQASVTPVDYIGTNQAGQIAINGAITRLPSYFTMSYTDRFDVRHTVRMEMFSHGQFRPARSAA